MRSLLLMLLVANAAVAADIDAAIERGKNYLLTTNVLDTTDHGIGPACLAGLALLECDVKPGDPKLTAIRSLVRTRAIVETGTYQTSLAIMFLDRYGSTADVGCIQVLGARLLAGQGVTGGWSYATFDAVNNAGAVAASMAAPTTKEKLCGEAVRIVNSVAQGVRAQAALAGDDNSNTQFAVVGLWVARRNGVPTDTAFRRLQGRFLRTQAPGDGGWGYTADGKSSAPSMTCAGLLALAAAKASGESELIALPADAPKAPDGQGDDPFYRPPPPGAKTDGADVALPLPSPVDPAVAAARDKAIERALKSLGQLLENPASIGAGGGYGGTDDLYFFWSVERVGVAFGLETIGSVDWYKWGSKAIVTAQRENGSWPGVYNDTVGTSFALLFLKKANFTSDLTRKIVGKVKDPGGGELRGGRGAGINPAGTPQNRKPGDDPKAPGVNAVRKTVEADKLADALVGASDRDWPAKLKAARETLGPQYTLALTKAIALLEGRRLYQAREALAERLTRMTPETLTRMLTDRDAELRRAACIAVAMKDDKALLPLVIDNVSDTNDLVVRAARASLKAISNEDLGPNSGATDVEKRQAADAWRLWYETDKRKRP